MFIHCTIHRHVQVYQMSPPEKNKNTISKINYITLNRDKKSINQSIPGSKTANRGLEIYVGYYVIPVKRLE